MGVYKYCVLPHLCSFTYVYITFIALVYRKVVYSCDYLSVLFCSHFLMIASDFSNGCREATKVGERVPEQCG